MAKNEVEVNAVPSDPMKQFVQVRLPRATGREEETLFVALNGKGYTIKRGTTVRLPKPVYAILVERERQIERQAAYEAKMQQKAASQDRQYGFA